jgi:hypothetical protein
LQQHLIRLGREVPVGEEQKLDPLAQVVVPEEQQIQRRFHFSHFMSALLTYFSEASKFGPDTMLL